MTRDPRVTPSNGRVAHVSLEGKVEAERFVKGRWMMVRQPMADIAESPRGARASQMLFGERFLALDSTDGFSFGMSERDGYVGYVLSGALTGAEDATHWVAVPATHLYPEPKVKAPPDVALFFGAQVTVSGQSGAFSRIQTGHYIPSQHLKPLAARYGDPVAVADLFLGTPYLWGGTSRWGIDCSGLVQAAFHACGIACPRDSDQQEAEIGETLDPDAPLARGDLVFWDGHVGMMADAQILLHANAHHMSVAQEPLAEAAARIAEGEYGPITSRKRVRPG